MPGKVKSGLMAPARVLIVDDDDVFRSEFAELLHEYKTIEAANGEQALRILQGPNEIDLVLLDVRMSGMDGIEVLEKIKKFDPDIRVVILTGFSSKDMAIDALRAKADDYIEKPVVPRVAREVVAKHMDAKAKMDYRPGIDGKIDRVMDYIRHNPDKKITLNEAAQLVCLCPKYLSRVFQERTRTGFNEFALSLKMENATYYLEHTADTVEQIAWKIGYLNPESFIRLFRKTKGLTPSQYRKAGTRSRDQARRKN